MSKTHGLGNMEANYNYEKMACELGLRKLKNEWILK